MADNQSFEIRLTGKDDISPVLEHVRDEFRRLGQDVSLDHLSRSLAAVTGNMTALERAGSGLGGVATALDSVGRSLSSVGTGTQAATQDAARAFEEMSSLAAQNVRAQTEIQAQGLDAQEEHIRTGMSAQTAVVTEATAAQRTVLAGHAAQASAIIGQGATAMAAETAVGSKERTEAVESGEHAVTAALRQGVEQQEQVVRAGAESIAEETARLSEQLKVSISAMELAKSFGITLPSGITEQNKQDLAATEAAMAKLGVVTREGAEEAATAVQRGMEKEVAAVQRGTEAEVAARRKGAQETRGIFSGLAEFTKNMALYQVGFSMFNMASQGVTDFARGLLTTNSELEQSVQTFSAVYGSAAKGQQAVAWLTDFAQKMPATRQEVIDAGLTIASLGLNIGEVMPALGNLSAVMGVKLPYAAQAITNALTGDTSMLRQGLHIQIEDLKQFGLQVEKNGQIVTSTFLPAFELLVKRRFLHGAELQMETFGGKISNVEDAFSKLQEVMGKGVFNVLKNQLDGVIRTLQGTDAQRWAMAIGDALGHALEGAIHFAQWMTQNFGPPIMNVINMMVGAWTMAAPAIGGALHVIEAALSTAATLVKGPITEAFQTAIGNIVNWWNDHGKDMGKVFENLHAAAEKFWTYLSEKMTDTMKVLSGAWEIAWGTISGVVAVAIDLIKGDWGKAKDDLIEIWKAYEVGALKIINGFVDSAIRAFGLLMPGVNAVLTFLVQTGARAFGMLSQIAVNSLDNIWVNFYNNLLGKMKGLADSPLGILLGPSLAEVQAQKPMRRHGAGDVLAAGAAAATMAPIIDIKFDPHTAIDKVDAAFGTIEGHIHVRMDDNAREVGKKWWSNFLAELKKHGIQLPTLGPTGPVPGPPAGTGFGGGGGTTGAADAAKAASDAYQRAQDVFRLFLARGAPGGYTVGMKDIAQIATTGHAAGQSDTQVMIQTLDNTNALIDKLLANSDKQFDFDSHVAHPSIRKLHEDEKGYLSILAHTPNITPADLAAARQGYDQKIQQVLQGALGKDQEVLADMKTLHFGHAALLAQVERIMKDVAAAGTPVGSLHYRAIRQGYLDQLASGAADAGARPEPTYRPYGSLGHELGFGSIDLRFGGPSSSPLQHMISILQQQLAYWRSRAQHDEQLLAATQQTAKNTSQTAQNTRPGQQGHEPAPPTNPQNVTGVVRGRGFFTPV